MNAERTHDVGHLSVERQGAEEAFESLRTDWNRILEQSGRPSIFLCWEWLYAWWAHFGRGHTLNLLVVRDATGSVVGVGPFCIERVGTFWSVRILRFLGTRRVSSEYLDVLAAPGREREVADAMFRFLREDTGSWDAAELSDLLDGSVALRFLEALARADRCAVGLAPGEVCPYLPLAGTLEHSSPFKQSTRRRLKYLNRALERLGCSYRTVETREELGPALEALFDLHERRWVARGQTGNFRDPAVRRFHHMLADLLGPQGKMRVYMMERGAKAIACIYVLQLGKTVYFYQSGFDPDPTLKSFSPGYTLLGHCIEDSVIRGAQEFDFLRGREDYKARWTTQVRESRKLTIVPSGHTAALARFRAGGAVRWAKRRAKALLSLGNILCAG